MTQASLQIDFRPQPRGIAVVTSAPISEIFEHSRYSVFQDLVDGYASSFAKVLVVSPNGKSIVAAKKAGSISWFSGPRWLSATNALWWTALANRQELRNVDLVRTFGPRAGIIGRALSRFSNSPHVSSADDLVSNAWREKTGWQAIIQRFASRQGVLKADVLSATLDWELEYVAETGYMNDLLLGARGLPTETYAPVSMTDPDRHPVVLWAGNVKDDDSVSLVAQVASSTQKMIPEVEFIVVAEGDAADRLKSTSAEQGLPLTVASYEEVEPLVDLIERMWACVTVPGTRQSIPHGLAMLALSAGKPMISIGDLGENHGFRNHLNYIRVARAESEQVAYSLQLLRRWSGFALRIGSAGRRLVEERYSTRSVALVEGERLARIATDLSVDLEMSDGEHVLQEFAAHQSSEVELPEDNQEHTGGADSDSIPGASQESAPEAEEGLSAGFDLVAAAIEASEASNVETQSAGAADDEDDEIAAAPDVVIPSEPASPGEDQLDDDLPQINMVEFDTSEIPSQESAEGTADEGIVGPVPAEDDSPVALDQDAISDLFAATDEDDEFEGAIGPGESDPTENDDSVALDQDANPELFAADEEDDQAA